MISIFFFVVFIAYVVVYVLGCFLANDKIDKQRAMTEGGTMLVLAIIAKLLHL